MKYSKFEPNYVKFPTLKVEGATEKDVWVGYEAIVEELKQYEGKTIVVDTYPGVRDTEILHALQQGLKPNTIVTSIDCFYEKDELTRRMQSHLTDDRVFGVMYYGNVIDFMDESLIKRYQELLKTRTGTTLIYGFGASLICEGDVVVYADLARWEIQQRYRSKEMGNYKCDNFDEDTFVNTNAHSLLNGELRININVH